MTVEVSPHKLMDLVFTLGVKILELVQISPHIETVRCENVRLPLDQVLALHPSDLTETSPGWSSDPHQSDLSPDRGEDVGQVGAGSLDAISVINPSLPGLGVAVKVLQVVVEVHVSRTEMSPEETYYCSENSGFLPPQLGCVSREERGHLRLPEPRHDQGDACHPFMEMCRYPRRKVCETFCLVLQ